MFKKLKEMFSRLEKPTAQASTVQAPLAHITIREILHATQIGTLQSVGLMQVIPLLSDLEDDRLLSPTLAEISTEGYGKLCFENPLYRPMLIPCHAGYVVKQAAQDHAMGHAGLIEPKGRFTFETAMCIQQTQGGYIAKGHHKMIILPYALREQALALREEKSFNKLWAAIQQFNAAHGLTAVGNLALYFTQFQQQLDHFVAEFECVPRQIGAIILINGEVVGIERAPSYAYWQDVWSALIRECYGSLAIFTAQTLREGAAIEQMRIPLPMDAIDSLDALDAALDTLAKQEAELAKSKVRELLDDPFTRHEETSQPPFVIETLQNPQFVGQIVRDHAQISYASLITSRQWDQQKHWRAAPAFSL